MYVVECKGMVESVTRIGYIVCVRQCGKESGGHEKTLGRGCDVGDRQRQYMTCGVLDRHHNIPILGI